MTDKPPPVPPPNKKGKASEAVTADTIATLTEDLKWLRAELTRVEDDLDRHEKEVRERYLEEITI